MNVGVLFLALLLPQEQQPADPAARKVNVTKAWYLKGPKWSADPIEKAEEGDEVTVLGTEGKYSKVRLKKKDLTAWIDSTALVTPDKFLRSESDEKVGTKASAQAMEAQRGLDQNMEREYRSQGGPAREQSFKDLDAWMARPSYYSDRARLIARLKEFQKEGKLGEYSPVK
jgi:hypothetical protein